MAFKINSTISQAAASSNGGGYLNPSKVPSGASVRFHIVSDEPLSYFECWGEASDGSIKPFRFVEDPSPSDITAEMGPNFSRRMNREGTAPEPVKPCISFEVYNYETEKVEICSFSQKSLIRELDGITQMPDYENLEDFDFILGKTGSGLTTEYTLRPVPVKKGAAEAIQAAVEASNIDIQKLLTGENPFTKG